MVPRLLCNIAIHSNSLVLVATRPAGHVMGTESATIVIVTCDVYVYQMGKGLARFYLNGRTGICCQLAADTPCFEPARIAHPAHSHSLTYHPPQHCGRTGINEEDAYIKLQRPQ